MGPFLDVSDLPEVRRLEENFESIRLELLALKENEFRDYPEDLVEEGWWHVYGFEYGISFDDHKTRCPITCQVLESFPSRGISGFSIIGPGTRLRRHAGGIDANVLRLHLGLIVPEGDIAIDVDGETRKWQEGKVLAFVDRLPHHVWNATKKARSVLLVDIPLPGTRLGNLNLVSL